VTSEPPKLADPDRRFYAWRQVHPNVAEDPRAAWAEGWRQGAWTTLRENAALGTQLLDVVQRIDALEQRLRDMQATDDIERELEASSAYWKSDA
jgi:hypothetical protein